LGLEPVNLENLNDKPRR